MIHVVLRGQLGNWLFQIATAINLANRRNCEVSINLSNRLRLRDWHGGWVKRQLRRFPLRATYSLRSPWLIVPRSRSGFQVPHGEPIYYAEKHFHFDPAVFDLPDGSVMYGFFQSERYFSESRDEIHRQFALPPLPERADVRDVVSRIETSTSVSVHVRRTDALTNHSLVVLGPEYYLSAFAELRRDLQRPYFFVFSDDLDWCRRHFSRFPDVEIVSVGRREDQPILDLTLMSRCRHHVLANSTFSWWGAWLDTRQAKRVIVPDRWFVDPEKDKRATAMLLPPNLGWWRRSPLGDGGFAALRA